MVNGLNYQPLCYNIIYKCYNMDSAAFHDAVLALALALAEVFLERIVALADFCQEGVVRYAD